MGRTQRKRKQKLKTPKNTIVNNDPSTIKLKQWLCANKWTDETFINISEFEQTGRGVLFKTKKNVGDKLISIPYSMLISLNTLQDDVEFNKQILEDFCTPLSMQQGLCLYILYHKHLGLKSLWHQYVDTIPKAFSVPYFCIPREQQVIPKLIHTQLEQQTENINQVLEFITNIKTRCTCCHQPWGSIFYPDVSWSYFAVNTRCVYVDPEIVKALTKPAKWLKDEPSIALAPLLDMFNHDCQAQTEAKLNMDLQTVLRYKDDVKLRLCYELYTLKQYEAYSECFISYGKHDNLKLLVEYGFFIPHNPYDSITINFEDIVLLSKTHVVQNFYKKQIFMQTKDLQEYLFLNSEGFSHNLIMLMHLFFNNTLLYFDEIYKVSDIEDVREPCRTLVENKIYEINNCLKKMLCIEVFTDSFNVVVKFMQSLEKMLQEILKRI